jgi:putative heme-binding domain-containing protein
MGIDGWIYIAIGDFGFVDAEGTDGTKLTMYGGGVVRVRPDGTEMEEYVHGLRNIYDIAIDPFMNMFTRGNTNDGGGWNMRFIHEIQSAQYGYPKLFKRYTSEILPALVDVGGGSGTGAMFFQEPGWPEQYNNVPMMCDWGRGQLIIHRVTPDGPSFTQEVEEFIRCGRITDVDCDGSGRMYLGSWGSSGFSGGTGGYVARVVPKGWEYKAFPDLKKMSDADVAGLLRTASAKTRLNAQQELLRRGKGGKDVLAVANDTTASGEARVAAIFTLKQLLGTKSHADLAKLTKDPAVQEHALRALADRSTQVDGIALGPFFDGLKSDNPRVQVAAAIGLGRLGNKSGVPALLDVSNPPVIDPLPMPKGVPAPKAAGSANSYESKAIEGGAIHQFDVDISGWKELHLTLGDGGNGTGSDHGSWFDPVLVKKDGSTIDLTTIKWAKATQGWGSTKVGFSATGAALARKDGKPMKKGIGTHSIGTITYKNLPADVVRFKCTAGLASTDHGGKVRFYVSKEPLKKFKGGGTKAGEGPHATPNSPVILPHVARKALVNLKAGTECVDAIGTKNQEGALMALREMHTPEAVDALINRFNATEDAATKQRIAMSLVRLVNTEKPYDGTYWWGTKPDTRGPYYYPTAWEKTDAIKGALLKAAQKGDPATTYVIAELAVKDRVEIDGLPKGDASAAVAAVEQPKVDLEKIKNQKGQIGKMSIEDILVAIQKVKGKPSNGPALFTSQGCVACHSLKVDEPQKGPFLGQIGSIMNAEKIAESIVRPNAEISQGFKTVQINMEDGKVHIGFVTERLSDKVTIRNIAGQVTVLRPADIKDEKLLPNSMMPEGLANGMSIEDFASLVHFLAKQKK